MKGKILISLLAASALSLSANGENNATIAPHGINTENNATSGAKSNSDVNLDEITVAGKADLSTTEGTGSYTTYGQYEYGYGAKFKHPRNAAVY